MFGDARLRPVIRVGRRISLKKRRNEEEEDRPRKSTVIKSRSPLTTKNYTVLGRVLHPNTMEEKYPRRPLLHFLTSKIGETLFTSKHLLHSDGLMRPKVMSVTQTDDMGSTIVLPGFYGTRQKPTSLAGLRIRHAGNDQMVKSTSVLELKLYPGRTIKEKNGRLRM
ncbi:hypothetical protein GHT06_013653 [Daphnia sinensis]|uniref:Uncharacterized protein n=1 Tax=Daphnia sinensis TaxID=1820382 RepID=A0AAD5PVH4_9CRUS|nr:hypothetical protein GHT06_013653 [Daphnia sinensis]